MCPTHWVPRPLDGRVPEPVKHARQADVAPNGWGYKGSHPPGLLSQQRGKGNLNKHRSISAVDRGSP